MYGLWFQLMQFVSVSFEYRSVSQACFCTILKNLRGTFLNRVIWKRQWFSKTLVVELQSSNCFWRTIVLDPKITGLELSATVSGAKNTENLQVQLPLKPLFTWLLFQYLKTTWCSMEWFYSEHLESNKWFWNKRDPLTCCLQVAHMAYLETTSTTITEWKLCALSLTVKLNWKMYRIKRLNIFNVFSKCQIRIGISKCR